MWTARESLEEGAVLLHGFVSSEASALLEGVTRVEQAARFRHLITPAMKMTAGLPSFQSRLGCLLCFYGAANAVPILRDDCRSKTVTQWCGEDRRDLFITVSLRSRTDSVR